MSYRQISDIIKTIHQFHAQLTNELQRHSNCNDDPRIDLLTDYVKHQRDAIADAVRRDEEQPQHNVLGTWLQFTPEEEIQAAMKKLQLREGEPVAELFTRVLEADAELQNLYQSMGEQASAQSVREFFNSLREASLSFTEQRSWGLREATN